MPFLKIILPVMKKIITFFSFFLLLMSLSAQTLERSFFIDFGTNDGLTSGPDLNGNYWNNINNPLSTSSPVQLITEKQDASLLKLQMVLPMQASSASFGGLLAPGSSLLGDLAIESATQDFFSCSENGCMRISGLNVNCVYRFKIFGSKKTTETRITQYSISGNNVSVGGLQVSGANLGGAGYNGNNSSVFTSDVVIPDAYGEVLLTISKLAGSLCHINAMKIEELSNYSVEEIKSIDVSGASSTNGATYQMSAKILPDNATYKNISWSVDDAAIATIDDSGLLTAKKNGTVTVTATTKQPNSTVCGSKTIDVSVANVSEISVSGTCLNGGSVYQMSATVLPDFATCKEVFWSVDKPKIASISSTGTLVLNGLGTVKVMAITKQPNSTITGSLEIESKIDDSLLDKRKITMMGSSVAYGVGALSFQGYAYMYDQLLDQRYVAGVGLDWTFSNISIGGNTTVALLKRWDSDLIPQYSKYVIYGLSLGNEGIVEGGQTIFEQYKNNMLSLIEKARAKGMIPVVTNCYSRADYDSVAYSYIRQMNLLMQKWDVPTVNVLGALDDGKGHWAAGYMNDGLHPNIAGHVEFSYTMVPSLFDALNAGKPLPYIIEGTYVSMGKLANSSQIEFTPENTIHPFTFSFDIKTSSVGTIASFKQGVKSGIIYINDSGAICYQSPNGNRIIGRFVNDGKWHKITLTHYYARGESILYSDNYEIGRISEKLEAKVFYLSDENAPNSIDYRNLFFYRSGLNADEIAALNNGDMLKSSLEIYAPLDGQAVIGADPYINMSQSTNVLKINNLISEIKCNRNSSDYIIYPCPVKEVLNMYGLKTNRQYECSIYGLDGRLVLRKRMEWRKGLDVSALAPAQYVLLLKDLSALTQESLCFTKE